MAKLISDIKILITTLDALVVISIDEGKTAGFRWMVKLGNLAFVYPGWSRYRRCRRSCS